MDKITVFDLKKFGLLTDDSDDIYVVSEINQMIENNDILGAFEMVAHSMDNHVKSLEDEIEELESDLDDVNYELEDSNDQLLYAEDEKEEAERRVSYLEDILNKHNISY